MDARTLLILTLTLIFTTVLIRVDAKRKTIVRFSKYELTNYQPELLKLEYYHNYTSDNASIVYANFTLTEDITSLYATLILGGEYAGRYYNHSKMEFDCGGLGGLYSDYVLQSLSVSIRCFSNIPVSCPFKKNKLYYVNGFKVLTDSVPSYLPELKFDSDFKMYVKKRLLFRLLIKGQFIRK